MYYCNACWTGQEQATQCVATSCGHLFCACLRMFVWHACSETSACSRLDAVHHAALQASHVRRQLSSRPTLHAASVTMSSPKGMPLHVDDDPPLNFTRSCCLTMQHGACMQEHQARQGRAGERPVHGELASGSAHCSCLQLPMIKV